MPDPEFIDLDDVTVASPAVRGTKGGVFAAATQSERDFYTTLMDSGMPEDLAFDRLVEMVSQRTSLATGPYKEPER